MRWDLSDLYRSVADPRISSDIVRETRRAAAFAQRYHGRVRRLNARQLGRALAAYETILQEAAKPVAFAHLLFSANTKPPAHGALVHKTEEAMVQIENQLRFFELELAFLPRQQFIRIVSVAAVAPWKHYLERIWLFRPHRLSLAEENILSEKRLTGARAWSRFFTQEHAVKQYQLLIGGRRSAANESGVLTLLYDSKRATRRAAQAALTSGLQEELTRMVFLFNTKLQDKKVNDRLTHYQTPEADRHLDNEISQKAVDALVATVSRNVSTVHAYYRLKRRLLGYKTLYDYDRYAPVYGARKRFTFAQARDMVVRSFQAFHRDFGRIAQLFFTRRWIDAEPRDGKRGGAFCSSVTPDLHPYVSVNFHGTPRDVMTLAHELGHGVHAYLAQQEHGYLTWAAPLTIAETASVFGELIVFDALKQSLESPRERLALLTAKIEDVFATVFRQIVMFKFERAVHAELRREGELPAETFNRLWRTTQQEMFGSSLVLTPGYNLWWSYVSHFVDTPFYVYAYAFGQLLTFSLWAKYQQDGASFIPRLLEFLKAGGSAAPMELLRQLDVDVEDPLFWQQGLETIKGMVAEAEALSREV